MIDIVRTDITTLDVDAIVNAANSALAGGRRGDHAGVQVARALRHPRGGPDLVGRHARRGGAPPLGVRSQLRARASGGRCKSIAFPAIATGVYGFPKQLAAEIATDSMQRHESWFARIVACVFDAETERLYREALG